MSIAALYTCFSLLRFLLRTCRRWLTVQRTCVHALTNLTCCCNCFFNQFIGAIDLCIYEYHRNTKKTMFSINFYLKNTQHYVITRKLQAAKKISELDLFTTLFSTTFVLKFFFMLLILMITKFMGLRKLYTKKLKVCNYSFL